MKLSTDFCLLAVPLLLLGCGSGGDSTAVAPPGTPSPVAPGPTNPTPMGPGQPTNPPGNPPTTPTVASSVQEFEMLASDTSSASIASSQSPTPQTVTISDTQAGDGKITVQIGSKVYELEGSDTNGTPTFANAASSEAVSVSQISKQNKVALALIGSDDGSLTIPLAGYSALGAPTTTAEVDVLKNGGATATYTGNSYLVANHENGFKDSATGDLVLNVDFGNKEFNGSMTLTSSETTGKPNFEITNVDASISNGKLIGPNLQAEVTVATGVFPNSFPNGANQLGLDTSVTGKLEGSFYGSQAEEVGGSFSFRGKSPDVQRKTIVVQGGFLGKQ